MRGNCGNCSQSHTVAIQLETGGYSIASWDKKGLLSLPRKWIAVTFFLLLLLLRKAPLSTKISC